MESAPNFVDAEIGKQVRMMREVRGISDEQVANRLGLIIGSYEDLERGLKRFSATQLRELSLLMNVNVAAFFNTIGGDSSINARAGIFVGPAAQNVPKHRP